VVGLDEANGIILRDRGSVVRRAVIDDDDFIVRVLQPLQSLETISEGTCPVVSANGN
jgi:hypothetical protein